MKHFFYLSILTASLLAESLDEVVDYALTHSTMIKQTKAGQELAKLKHKQSKAQRYGEFDIVGNYTHYNLPRTLAPLTPSTIAAGQPITTTKDLYSAGVTYNVPLFTGFAQTRNVEIEHLAKEMADVKLKLTKEQLVYNVRSLYVTILSLREMLQAQKAYTKALSKLHEQIRYEVSLGKKAKIDLYKADASLQGSRTQEQVIEANLNITKATLASLVGKKIDRFAAVPIDVRKNSYDMQELQQTLVNLKKVEAETLSVEKAEKMVSKTESVRYPQVGLSAYLGKNYGEDLKSNDWDDETLWQAGLNVKYNVLDFGQSAINIQKAKIAKMQAVLHKEQTLLDLQKELQTAISKISQNRAVYVGNKAAHRLSAESEKIEKVRYEHGASTLNDLLLAQSRTQQAKAKTIQSKYDYQKSIYYLDYLLEKGSTDENK